VFPKPKRIRDKQAIKKARREWCEYCGKGGWTQVHHIVAVGFAQRGHDIPENLVALCVRCHTRVHNWDPQREKEKLVKIVAWREGKTEEEIQKIIEVK